MVRRYPDLAFGDAVREAQRQHGSRPLGERLEAMEWDDRSLGEREKAHVAALDHFHMASVGESGWPYVQFRGGPEGFLKVLGPRLLGFADFRGNRQYISTGNVRADDRVALLLLDPARRTRLKVFARAEVRPVDGELAELLTDPEYDAVVERAFLFHVEAFDWNCPQHITPRYTVEELRRIGPEAVMALFDDQEET